MRSNNLVFIILIISGFLLSYVLSPRDQELALIYMKEGRIELAKSLYVNLFQEDTLSRTNLFSLKQVFVEQGDIGQAISLYENFVKENPDDLEILEQLAKLYKDSHREYDYMHTLEKLTKNNPSVEQMEELLNFYIVYEKKEDALAILILLVEQDSSRHKDYQQIVNLQASLGDYERAEDTLTAYFQTSNSVSQINIDMRLKLLLLSKRMEKAISWIKSGELNRDQLISIYYAASSSGEEGLSLEVARHIQARFKNPDDMKLLAQTLFKQNKIKEVVTLLKYNKNVTPELASLYEHSLMLAWKKDASIADELAAIWQQQLKSPYLSKTERRELAFKLLEKGKKEASVKEFKHLAKNEGPNGVSVKQLLYIWGAFPEWQEIDWIEYRARNATGNELAGWWEHLDQVGASNRIVAIANDMSVGLYPDAEALLMNTLMSSGDKLGIDTYIRKQINKALKVSRLEKLAEYAHDAGLESTEAFVWYQVAQRNPGNKKINNALGMMAFSDGNLLTAESQLKRYLEKTDGDWESTFYLGEAMHANGRKKAATIYFERSLLQTEQIANHNKQLRRTRALIFFRLARAAEAMQEFDKLIKDFPADNQLRAEYSTLLIEQGKLKKARRLLANI